MEGLVQDNGNDNSGHETCASCLCTPPTPSLLPLPLSASSLPYPLPSLYSPLSPLSLQDLMQLSKLTGSTITLDLALPFEATRRHSASPKTFMAKREEREEEQSDTGSKDPDGLVKAIAVVAMYQGQPEMLDNVEQCVRVTQVSGVSTLFLLSSLPPSPLPHSLLPHSLLPIPHLFILSLSQSIQ